MKAFVVLDEGYINQAVVSLSSFMFTVPWDLNKILTILTVEMALMSLGDLSSHVGPANRWP